MKHFGKLLGALLALLLVFSCTSCSLLGLDSLFGFSSETTASQNGETTERKPGETSYSAVYDLGYGDLQEKYVYYSSDGDYVPKTPVRRGYRFLHWLCDGKESDGKIPAGSSGDLLFVACWELITYTVTYENMDGIDVSGYPSTFTVESPDILLPDPSRLGYFFNGWQIGDAQPTKQFIVEFGKYAENLTIRAIWGKVNFTATSSNGTPVTAAFGDPTVGIGTVVRVTAPVYTETSRFSHWELNGSRISESAFLTFPIPSLTTEIKAVYTALPIVNCNNSGSGQIVISDLVSGTPDIVLGAGAKPEDYTVGSGSLTLKADFLRKLEPGDYRFYVACVSAGEITSETSFTLRVAGSASAAPDYSSLTGDGASFRNATFSYGGGTYPRVASTDAEFRRIVEYFVLVDGVLQMQASGNNTAKEFTFDLWVCGDLNTRLLTGENILSTVTGGSSYPMHPCKHDDPTKSGIGMEYYTKSAVGSRVTLKVQYGNGLNAVRSSQAAEPGADRQKLLTSPGRATDFNAFPIDALTVTAPVRTLYELEALPFGAKPEFAAGATEAQSVYNTARSILRTIVDDGMNDYEKVTAIYAWLALNVTYDDVTFRANDSTTAAYTVKGALLDRVAVCDGYASAFRLLCQIEGIRAEEVTGLNELGNKSTGHAWSKVWIGGAVYGVDSTWGRQQIEGAPVVTMKYLFMDEATLLQNEHYENADPYDPYVEVLADAGACWQAANVIDKSGNTFVIGSDADYTALVKYLKAIGAKVGEFILIGDSLPPFPYSADVANVYTTSGNYGYVVLK